VAELPPERRAVSPCSHPLIEKRRSTRAFADMPVPRETIDRLVQSFRWAPSCGNKQPWRLVVTTRSPQREALDATLMEGNEWARAAPIVAAVAMNPAEAATVNGINYAPFDAGLAVQNLLIAATAEGMVGHPMAGYDEAAARTALGVPDPWRIATIVAIGFPGAPELLDPETRSKDERPRKRKPTAELVTFESWTGK
jgi:nitroreductase